MIRLQCVAALVLGVAVLLSALFWLPPFAGRGGGKEGPDPGDEFGGEPPLRIARSRSRSPVVAEWCSICVCSALGARWWTVGFGSGCVR